MCEEKTENEEELAQKELDEVVEGMGGDELLGEVDNGDLSLW